MCIKNTLRIVWSFLFFLKHNCYTRPMISSIVHIFTFQKISTCDLGLTTIQLTDWIQNSPKSRTSRWQCFDACQKVNLHLSCICFHFVILVSWFTLTEAVWLDISGCLPTSGNDGMPSVHIEIMCGTLWWISWFCTGQNIWQTDLCETICIQRHITSFKSIQIWLSD